MSKTKSQTFIVYNRITELLKFEYKMNETIYKNLKQILLNKTNLSELSINIIYNFTIEKPRNYINTQLKILYNLHKTHLKKYDFYEDEENDNETIYYFRLTFINNEIFNYLDDEKYFKKYFKNLTHSNIHKLEFYTSQRDGDNNVY